MDKTKYIKWYKIAQETINDEELIPRRTDEEILECVSRVDWLMFVPKDVTIEQAKNSPEPSIYFYISEHKGNVIGVSFNNLEAVKKIRNILSPYSVSQKEAVVKKLLQLDQNWKTTLFRKVKKIRYERPPEYHEALSIDANKIDDTKITEFFNLVDQIRKEGKIKRIEERTKNNKYYLEVPSIDLILIEIPLEEQIFKKRIIEAFDVLKICLGVKSDAEIRRIQREEQKPVKVRKCSECCTYYEYDTNRTRCAKSSCSSHSLIKSTIPKIEYENLVRDGKVKD